MSNMPVEKKHSPSRQAICVLIVYFSLMFMISAQEEINEDGMKLVPVREKDLKKITSPENLIQRVKDKKFIGEGISFTFIKTEKSDIIRAISRMIGQEITIDPDIRGKVTYRLKEVPWNRAVALFLKDNNLEFVFDGITLRIREKGSTGSGGIPAGWIITLLILAGLAGILIKKVTPKKSKKGNVKPLMDDSDAAAFSKNIIYLLEVEKIFRDDTLTLDTLSEKLGIKKYQLSWIINKKINRTFADLLNHYRVEDAKNELLKSGATGKTILDIVYDTGFSTKTAFNRTFKRATGMTPSQYKEKNKK